MWLTSSDSPNLPVFQLIEVAVAGELRLVAQQIVPIKRWLFLHRGPVETLFQLWLGCDNGQPAIWGELLSDILHIEQFHRLRDIAQHTSQFRRTQERIQIMPTPLRELASEEFWRKEGELYELSSTDRSPIAVLLKLWLRCKQPRPRQIRAVAQIEPPVVVRSELWLFYQELEPEDRIH